MYCDFYSTENHETIDKFLDALHQDIDLNKNYGEMEKYQTIYFGGGTPSLLKPEQIEEIIDHLEQSYTVAQDLEITMEVNPGTVDREKLEGYRSAGINRLSIGVQSFDDKDLHFLTRIHTSKEATRSIILARECGFDNLSIDLIYALPDQELSNWETTLLKAISFKPEHISAYSLIVEENTLLAASVSTGRISPLAIEDDATMYELTMEMMLENGYEHYEVSNYAKPGYHSRHNTNYWNHSNYLGFGPSAHSYWAGRRWWNIRDIEEYCRRITRGVLPIDGEELLTDHQLLDETVMLGLRTGVLDISYLKKRFKIKFTDELQSIMKQSLSDKLAIMEDDILRLTNKGFLVCDELSQRILSAIQ